MYLSSPFFSFSPPAPPLSSPSTLSVVSYSPYLFFSFISPLHRPHSSSLWPRKCRPEERKTFEKLFFFSYRPALLSTWTVKVETKDVQQKALKSACEPDLAPLSFFITCKSQIHIWAPDNVPPTADWYPVGRCHQEIKSDAIVQKVNICHFYLHV